MSEDYYQNNDCSSCGSKEWEFMDDLRMIRCSKCGFVYQFDLGHFGCMTISEEVV